MKKKILIVEDELFTFDEIKEVLASNYDILPYTKTVKDAKDKIINLKPHLVVIDIRLPGKEDGIHLAQYLKVHNLVPFIFLTVKTDKETLNRLEEFTEFYIKKPICPVVLTTNIRSRLKQYDETIGEGISARLVLSKKYVRQIIERLPFENIAYITTKGSEPNYVDIYTDDGKRYRKRKTLKDIIKPLPSYFEQVRNSYIVNVRKIEKFEKLSGSIYVSGSPAIRISSKFKSAIQPYLKYFF